MLHIRGGPKNEPTQAIKQSGLVLWPLCTVHTLCSKTCVYLLLRL